MLFTYFLDIAFSGIKYLILPGVTMNHVYEYLPQRMQKSKQLTYLYSRLWIEGIMCFILRYYICKK